MGFWKDLFTPDDWELRQALQGKWDVTVTRNDGTQYVKDERCLFEIYYSKHLNKYRVECSGYRPKEHSLYPDVVQWIAKSNDGENPDGIKETK